MSKFANIDFGISLGDAYKEKHEFVSTGCTTVDLALGGGFVMKRVVNIWGDESTGKTLLALSAAKQFQKKYGERAVVVLDDAESAIDPNWLKRAFRLRDDTRILTVERGDASPTVQGFSKNFMEISKKIMESNMAMFYLIDSWDALEISEVEDMLDSDLSMKDTLFKPKRTNDTLRKVVKRLGSMDGILILISQSRAKIGVMFGDKKDITGGAAIKFYSSQRIKMSERGKIVNKNKFVVGIDLHIKAVKNKVSRPFLEAQFPIYFDSGIDNIEACIAFLKTHKKIIVSGSSLKYDGKSFIGKEKLIDYIYSKKKNIGNILELVKETWDKVYAE